MFCSAKLLADLKAAGFADSPELARYGLRPLAKELHLSAAELPAELLKVSDCLPLDQCYASFTGVLYYYTGSSIRYHLEIIAAPLTRFFKKRKFAAAYAELFNLLAKGDIQNFIKRYKNFGSEKNLPLIFARRLSWEKYREVFQANYDLGYLLTLHSHAPLEESLEFLRSPHDPGLNKTGLWQKIKKKLTVTQLEELIRANGDNEIFCKTIEKERNQRIRRIK